MPAVYTFTRSHQEALDQLLRVFRDGGVVKETWAMQAELLVEPTGWDALWKLSKHFCAKFEVRFPCVACVTVTSVDFEELTASVDVTSVQHEAVTLPERVEDVPLIELWPTLKQSEQCIDAGITAEFIDLMRFFFNNIWMPWDDQDDKILLPTTIEDRMQLWADLHNGKIPNSIARTITLLRNSAINAHEKLKELDSSFCADDSADDDDSMLSPNYIAQYAEQSARLEALAARWPLFERGLVRAHYLAALQRSATQRAARRNVVALWQGGSLFEFEKLSEFLRSQVHPEQTLTVTPSAEDALALQPERLVACSAQCELPEVPLANIDISSYNGATLKSSETRSCLLNLSEECALRDLTLQCAAVSTLLVARGGALRVERCVLRGEPGTKQSDFAQGLVAMAGSNVLVEDTTFDSFYTAIVVHKGAQVELRNCSIQACGVGVQLYAGARVRLRGCAVAACSERSLRYEHDGSSDHTTDLHIAPCCTIGGGDLSRELLTVRQDVDLM